MMASRNDSTGDLMISKSYSEEGKNNFDNIFGARDWRNRPINQEATKESLKLYNPLRKDTNQ